MRKNTSPIPAIEAEPWLYRVNQLADTIGGTLKQSMRRAFGVTPSEWRLLIALDPLISRSPTELAQHLQCSEVAISRALARLHALGYLVRTADESDARKFNIRIHASGIGLRAQVTVWWADYEATLLGDVPAQSRETVLTLLHRCAQKSRVRRVAPTPSRQTAKQARR